MNRLPGGEEKLPDWSTPWKPSFFGHIRNLIHEVKIYVLHALKRSNVPTLLIFPCASREKNPASLLRAFSVGEYLENQCHWKVTIVPPQFTLKQRQRIIHMQKPNLIFMQMERHPLNRPKFYKPVPVVFDIDDADFLWDHAREIVAECCEDSVAVVAGSQFIANWAKQYNDNVEIIWTGINDASFCNAVSQSHRGNVIAWGHSRPCDYLQESRYIENALLKVAEREQFEYWIFGVENECSLTRLVPNLLHAGITVKAFAPMPIDLFTQKLSMAAIGLQVLSPQNDYSQGKSFGKILNYILAGTTVVASSGADHSLFFVSGQNGILVNNVEEMADAILELLKSPDSREVLTKNALIDLREKLSLEVISNKYNVLFNRCALKTSKG